MHVHYLLQMEKTGQGPPGPLKQTFPQRCLWAVWAGLTGLGDPVGEAHSRWQRAGAAGDRGRSPPARRCLAVPGARRGGCSQEPGEEGV